MSVSHRTLLLLPVLLVLSACAPPQEGEGEATELSETEDTDAPTELAWECRGPCTLSAIPAPTPDEARARKIADKLASLDEWTRGWVFATPVGDVVATSSSEGYQMYEGFFGRAVVFTSRWGTYVSYGPLVEAWERTWYLETDRNPPLNDPYDFYNGVRQDFDAPVDWEPCFQDSTLYVVMDGDGSTRTTFQKRYKNSLEPDLPYSAPPEHSYIWTTPLKNIFDSPPTQEVWCGPTPPWVADPDWQDPNAGEFDPTTI